MTAETITQSAVRDVLTVNRRKHVVETESYGAFSRRVVRAYSRRVGAGDIAALSGLLQLASELQNGIDQAVNGLRQAGYSWSEIAAEAGISRQTAWERWNASLPQKGMHDVSH